MKRFLCWAMMVMMGASMSDAKAEARDVFALAETLVAQVPFEKDVLEATLKARLTQVDENDFFTLYTAESALVLGDVQLTTLDVRLPKRRGPDISRGFVMASLKGGCVSEQQVKDRYGKAIAPIYGVHPMRNLYYQTMLKDVALRFGVDTETGCVTHLVVDAQSKK